MKVRNKTSDFEFRRGSHEKYRPTWVARQRVKRLAYQMADWTKFNGERGSSRLSSDDDDLASSELASGAISPTGDNVTNNSSGRRALVRQRSCETPHKDIAIVRRSLVKRDNDDLVGIFASNENLIPISKLGYENNLALVDNGLPSESKSAESRRILNFNTSTNDLASGSQIRRDARKELSQDQQQQQSQRRPSSLYNDDNILDSEKLRNIFNGEKDALIDCAKPSKNDLIANENSTEKLVNGSSKSPCNDNKQTQHHVQFKRKFLTVSDNHQKKNSGNENPRASPSISTTSSSSSEDNSSLDQLSEARPPDGGWGWVVVAAAFMVNLIADGITFSFGVIYHEFLIYFGEGKATTSWIGSLFMAMPLLSGPIASFLTDRYGCRKVTIAGSILATLGFVISYFANSMGVLILTFGVLAGFGLSLCFVAAVVIVAYYFDKRRSFATGLSVCGSGIGTFIFPPLIQKLLTEYGWRGTTLILAGLFLNLAVCGCLMRDLEWTTIKAKTKTEERRKIREKKMMRVQSSSADSVSASSSANTAQTLHGDPKRPFISANAMIIEGLRLNEEQDGDKLFSSLVNLPTFVKNGEKVPLEVLELLSTRKNVYNVLLQNYPSLLISSRSFSDSSGLNDQLTSPSARFVPTLSPLAVKDKDKGNTESMPPQDEHGQGELDSQVIEIVIEFNNQLSINPWRHILSNEYVFIEPTVSGNS